MNKTKLSAHQLFSLIVLFELGSAIVVGVGKEAKQDAWLAVLLGMVAGLGLFMIYGWLHKLYPELSLSNILEKVLGKWLGRLLGVLYILYFLYISCRLLRDFGALLLTAALPETPIYIVTFMMALVIVYASYLGIETIGKTGELLYIFFTMMLGLAGLVLILISNVMKAENLMPVLERGWKPVVNAAFPQVYTFPFGEMVIFTMLMPYLHDPRRAIQTGLKGMLLSGLILTLMSVIYIGVLGVYGMENAVFPLLKMTARIQVGDFIQHLESIALVILIVGGFLKCLLFFLRGRNRFERVYSF